MERNTETGNEKMRVSVAGSQAVVAALPSSWRAVEL